MTGQNPVNSRLVEKAFFLAAGGAAGGQPSIVKALLEAGVNVHAEDDLALYLAVIYGSPKTIQMLLDAGADVHARGGAAIEIARSLKKDETLAILSEWARTHPRPSRAGNGPQPSQP